MSTRLGWLLLLGSVLNILICGNCLTSEVRAAESSPGDLKETLVTLEKQSWQAWQARDPKFFERFLSEDHVELYSSGALKKAEVVATVASPSCVVNSYRVDKFELIPINPDAALLTYYAEQDTQCGGKKVPSPAWVSSLYVRRDGRWLNLFYQQTPVP